MLSFNNTPKPPSPTTTNKHQKEEKEKERRKEKKYQRSIITSTWKVPKYLITRR